MATRNNRYRQMRKVMTYILLSNAAVFIIYLFAAGFNIVWLKTMTSIISITTSILTLGYLYLIQEMFKKRSLWMTAAAAAILFCVLYSLVLRFPCPAPTPDNLPI